MDEDVLVVVVDEERSCSFLISIFVVDNRLTGWDRMGRLGDANLPFRTEDDLQLSSSKSSLKKKNNRNTRSLSQSIFLSEPYRAMFYIGFSCEQESLLCT